MLDLKLYGGIAELLLYLNKWKYLAVGKNRIFVSGLFVRGVPLGCNALFQTTKPCEVPLMANRFTVLLKNSGIRKD